MRQLSQICNLIIPKPVKKILGISYITAKSKKQKYQK